MKLIDLTGEKFERLIVICRVDNDKWGNLYWLCKCDCGKEKIVRGDDLKSNEIRSCGCLRREKMVLRSIKHGHYNDETYRSWSSMGQRCTNPNHKYYEDYGGRGIIVCKRWLKFENFLEDMGERPRGLSLDRKNNNKNYCKSNCRWATKKQQMRNMRSNRLITYKGKTQCIAAWAEEFNISYDTLWKRLYKFNWSIEEALTTPVGQRKKKL